MRTLNTLCAQRREISNQIEGITSESIYQACESYNLKEEQVNKTDWAVSLELTSSNGHKYYCALPLVSVAIAKPDGSMHPFDSIAWDVEDGGKNGHIECVILGGLLFTTERIRENILISPISLPDRNGNHYAIDYSRFESCRDVTNMLGFLTEGPSSQFMLVGEAIKTTITPQYYSIDSDASVSTPDSLISPLQIGYGTQIMEPPNPPIEDVLTMLKASKNVHPTQLFHQSKLYGIEAYLEIIELAKELAQNSYTIFEHIFGGNPPQIGNLLARYVIIIDRNSSTYINITDSLHPSPPFCPGVLVILKNETDYYIAGSVGGKETLYNIATKKMITINVTPERYISIPVVTIIQSEYEQFAIDMLWREYIVMQMQGAQSMEVVAGQLDDIRKRLKEVADSLAQK